MNIKNFNLETFIKKHDGKLVIAVLVLPVLVMALTDIIQWLS